MSDSKFTHGRTRNKALSGSVARSGWILLVVGVVMLALALVFGFLRGDGLPISSTPIW